MIDKTTQDRMLALYPMLHALPAPQLEDLLAAATYLKVPAPTVMFDENQPCQGFPLLLATLGGAAVPCVPGIGSGCLIDATLSTGTKSGYLFTAVGSLPDKNGANTVFVSNGNPNTANTTGVKGFCGSEDNVIRFVTPSAGPVAHDACQGEAAIGQ